MSSQDKQVRITIAVDESSAAKAKRAISDLVVEVNRLVEATNKVNLGFGGGGGGGMGARVGSMSAQPGTSATAQATHKASAAGGGLTDNLTRAVQGSATLFRGAAEGSKTAFKSMTDSLKDFSRATDQEINRLVGSLGKLDNIYGRLARSAPMSQASVVGDLRARYSDAMRADTLAGRLEGTSASGAPNAASELRARLYGAPSYGPKQEGGGGGIMNGIRGAFGKGASALGGVLGTAGLGFLAGASIPAVISGTATYLARSHRDYLLSGYEQTMERPMWSGNMGAQLGGIFGGQAQAIRHGDYARGYAIHQVGKTNEFKQLMSKEYDTALKASIDAKYPTGLGGSLAGGQLGANVSQNVGRGWERLWTGFKNGFGRPSGPGGAAYSSGQEASGGTGSFQAGVEQAREFETRQEFARSKAMAEAKVEQAQKAYQMTQNYIASKPRLVEAINDVVGGAGGMIGLADASRTSGGFRQNKKTGVWSNTTNDFMERAMSHGWDPGALAGTMGSLVPQLGWAQSGNLAGRVMSASAGGFGSVGSVLGAGGQYGGSLYGSVQKRIGGRGGLDIGAGSNIAAMVASMLTSGGFGGGGGGSGLADILLGAAGGGGGFGDMLGARQVQGGVGATDRMMSGGIDSLQKGLNASAALKAAGNSPYGAQSMLMGMSSGTALDIVRTGKVGGVMSKAGISADMVRKYLAAQDETAFSRVDSSMLSKEQQSAVSLYRKSGLTKGADLESLAGALMLGTGDSQDDAMGRLRIQSERLFPTKAGGHGAGRSSSATSQARAAFKSLGVGKGIEGRYNYKERGAIDEAIANANGSAADLDWAGEKAGANAGSSSSAAIDNVQAALMIFVQTLKREVDGGGKSGPMSSSAQ